MAAVTLPSQLPYPIFCVLYCKYQIVYGFSPSYRRVSLSLLVNVSISTGSLLSFFSILENKLTGYADDSTLIAVVSSPGVKVAVADSLSSDLVKVSDWCDLWEMKLNASKTKTMMVSRSRRMHSKSPALTIGETVLKESDFLVILGVIFDYKMTFEKNFRSVSRAASQRLGILRKSWQVFHDRLLLGRCFRGFVLPVLEYCSAVWCSAADHTLNNWTALSVVPVF